MKSIKKIFFLVSIILLFFFILILPVSSAEDYYADIDIIVDNSGFVTITGVSNYPDLLVENSEVYTSKEKSLWLLNITKNELFSDYVFSVTFPKGSSINYINSDGPIRIEEKSGNLIVKGFGENKPLSIVVQYQLRKIHVENNIFEDYIFLFLLLIIFVLIISLVFYVVKNKKTVSYNNQDKYKNYSLKGLNTRQKKIVKILIDTEKPLTQTEIQKTLNIPKAAVSRNIHSLEIKGIIEIEKIGMSNLIRLKNTK